MADPEQSGRKRSRKRTRGKKRSAKGGDNGGQDGVESVEVRAADGASAAPETAPPEPASESDPDSDAGADDVRSRKRKRRSRKRKKEKGEAAPPVDGPLTAGPDPASLPWLSESAQRAIAYAQTYLEDRDAWKFSKPRQNWLLRHVLWSPSLQKAAAEAEAQPNTALAEHELAPPEEGTCVPEEHVPVVAAYLASVQGSALQRLLSELDGAAKGWTGPPPEDTLQEAQNGGAEQAIEDGDAQVTPEEGAARPEAQGQEPAPSVSLPHLYSLRAQRAQAVLAWIKSRISTEAYPGA